MIYVILSFIALLLAIAFCVSFIMYIQDRRRQRSVQDTARRHTLEIPSYELSSWIDDEIAARKLYRKPDMSAAELAEELGISERRLRHTIYTAYNKTFSDYLDDRRIQAACRLLREQPDMTLEAISIETGFTSQNAFHTAFKNTMGQTPGQYRIMITQQKK